MRAYAWTDGSNGPSKGTCGAASYVIADVETREIIKEGVVPFYHTDEYKFTNQDMEMTAVLLCLQAAVKLGVTDLSIHSDSEWVVKIIRGEFRLKMQKFVSTVEEIMTLARTLDFVSIRHVRRELNPRSDWLCTKTVQVKGSSRQAKATCPSLVWSTY